MQGACLINWRRLMISRWLPALATTRAFLLVNPQPRRSTMQVETTGSPRVTVAYEGKVVQSSRPGCLEVVVTLTLGGLALMVILGFLP
jgi:hypothetical protein